MSAAIENGAAHDPFGLTANPDGYFPTAAIERVLADAQAALDAGNVPVIAGPTGLGKTLVLQLIVRAREPAVRAIYIPFCTLGPAELARLALGLLGVEPADDPEAEFLAEAQRAAREGRSLLLLVDDAAALPGETAAQLATWLISSGGALQIVLAGLPGPALRHARDAFGDRAEDLLLVSGLRPEELRGYVHTRLAAVGASAALRAAFDDAAIGELARVSEGNPRRMNLAAQAIVRSLRAEIEAETPEEQAPAARAAASANAPARISAQDLASVGEYRFVRGRFIDPHSGQMIADAPETVPRVEKTTAPLPPRRRTAPPPAFTPPLEIDRGPEDAGEPWLEVDEEIPPPVVVHPPTARPALRAPLQWIAAGIGLLAFAVGAWWQLGGEEELPTARVTIEPLEIGKIGRTGTGAVPEAQPPAIPVTPGADVVAPESPALAPAAPGAEVAAVTPANEAAAVVTPLPVPAPAPGVPATPPTGVTADVTPVAPASPAPVVSEVAPAPVPPPPPAETVSVAINATPWAVIEVDGEEIGETPLAGIRLATGRHRFRARMPDGSVRERVIRIDADTTTVVFE